MKPPSTGKGAEEIAMRKFLFNRQTLLILVVLLLVRATRPQDTEHKERAKPVTLQVRVLDKDSQKPIRDAEVWVKSEQESEDFDETVTTNNDGAISLPGVPQGAARIIVTAKGWHPSSRAHKLDHDPFSVVIQLEKAPPPPPTPPSR
jgi:5-hydroxyisourate hydrolase-like protein (transthyretin family)